MNDGKLDIELINLCYIFFLILVRKGLQTLVGAQLVFGHGNQSGSHAQLNDNIIIDSILTPHTIAESYDEAIIPFGRKIFFLYFLFSIY
jgi:hypothetical protein